MINKNVYYALLFIFLGYFLGSIMFGYLILKTFKKVDIIKESKDNNPGTANAYLYGGMVCGTSTLILDLLKGFIPVYVAKFFINIDNYWFILIMIAPVIGHAYPIYQKLRKGGKCIAVSFGVLLGLCPYLRCAIALAFWYIFFSTLIVIKPHALRSVLTYLCFFITIIFIVRIVTILISCLIISLIVILKHIKSLKKMEEPKVCFAFRRR